MKLPRTIPLKSVWLFPLSLAGLVATLNAQQTGPAAAVLVDQTAAPEPTEEARKQAKLDCAWLPFPDSAKFKVLGL